MSISAEKLDHIRDLERRHVEIYYQLLETLDELYLVKETDGDIALDATQTSLLEMRRQMQFNVDKSVALAKTYERLNNMRKSGEGTTATHSEEDLLALSLEKELQEGETLNARVYSAYEENKELVRTLQEETAKYRALILRLQKLRPARGLAQSPNTLDSPSTGSTSLTTNAVREDTRITSENEVLEQLLTALRIHTGAGRPKT
ncbi:Mcm16 protein [Maudiozyma humilis]|uniref:Mcm16 protein n=1 Tax=Maudiozyma humilis TaxID=51915 RepID=A0AAV5S5N9_MAUHU|nr:Mcm16 protein [Kazachstania humilis]